MFQLHDITRRRVCVAGFLTLGVTPLLLVGGWCVGRHAPGHVLAEAQQLSRQVGLDVKLSGVEHPRPGTVLYEQLEAADPETGRMVFRCRRLEIAPGHRTDQQGNCRSVMELTASQPEVDTAAMARVWQCLRRVLEGPGSSLDVQLSAGDLTLRAAQDSQTLTDVTAVITNLPDGAIAQLDFRLAGVKTPAQIRVVRDRQASPPASGFELNTGDGELPCSVLALGLDELKTLGSRCRFRGWIGANETLDGWQGAVRGQLVELDLGRLVSDHFPHRLTGIATVTIPTATFRRGRLDAGRAIVEAGPGEIARSLLAAAVDRLGLIPAPAVEQLPAVDCVPYGQLAFSATLDAKTLRLDGQCQVAEKGTILSYDGRCLLGEPRQPAPAVALVQMLVPDSAVQVPASRQTNVLLSFLPVQDAIPVPGPEAVSPRATVRLREPWRR
jgi:hypothetical protein